MKKIILFLLLLINVGYSQIDTANYNFNLDLLTGKYTSLISKSTIFGAQGFKYVVQELQSTSIDTTLFQYVGNIDGKYTTIQNISTYYGKDSGTVQMQLVNGSTGSSIDTSLIPFLNQNNTFTGAINTFTGKMVVGTGTSNGTADFLVMGDTTTIRGTTLRDSSYLRVMINPFSNRLKIEAIGKLGNNMFTIDSTLITSALAMTITGDFTTGGNIFAGSNNKYIGWSTRSLMKSGSDGDITITNYAESTGARLIFGTATLNNIPTYADNTAALAGGLTAGQIYVTSTGVLMRTY